jgi:hypothetical protein
MRRSVMVRTFSLVMVMVALVASPCLAEVAGKSGTVGRRVSPSKGIIVNPDVIGPVAKLGPGTPKGIIANGLEILGAHEPKPTGKPGTGVKTPLGDDVMLADGPKAPSGNLSSGKAAKSSAVPGPVPLKEQMKARFKNRIGDSRKGGK